MPKSVLLLLASICLLCFNSIALGQLKVDEEKQLTRMINQHRLLTVVADHLTIVENSSSLLFFGARNLITGGNNFLGIVKSYEMMANGKTIVGIAITKRVHSYTDNSMALIAVGGSAGDSDDSVYGLTMINKKSMVGLAIGELAFVEDNARIGVVVGDISFIHDKARVGVVIGEISHIRHDARVFLQIGGTSPRWHTDHIGLVINRNSISSLATEVKDFFQIRDETDFPHRTPPRAFEDGAI